MGAEARAMQNVSSPLTLEVRIALANGTTGIARHVHDARGLSLLLQGRCRRLLAGRVEPHPEALQLRHRQAARRQRPRPGRRARGRRMFGPVCPGDQGTKLFGAHALDVAYQL